MAYRHRGGPKNGVYDDDVAADYTPIDMSHGHSGSLPGFTQDVLWKDCEIIRAEFTHDREEFRVEVGKPIRKLKDERGRQSFETGRQTVLALFPGGTILFDKGGEWGQSAQVPGFRKIEIAESPSAPEQPTLRSTPRSPIPSSEKPDPQP